MPRGPARPYPSITITDAARIAQAIRDNNAGHDWNRVLLAEALGWSPSGSGFRDLIATSAKYGFTKGNFHSETIGLTDLGVKLTVSRGENERLDAMRQGFRRIPLFNQMLTHFNNNKLPPVEYLENALQRDPFKVTPEWSEEAARVFIANGKAVGFIRDVGGSPYVVLEAGPPTADVAFEQELGDQPDAPVSSADGAAQNGAVAVEEVQESQMRVQNEPPPKVQEGPSQLQFFIAHGYDTDAVQDVQRILDELGIPYVVAVEEPNAGRPISQKVKDLMDACSAGIFIFSADEEFRDKEGNVIYRPRENVIYELGAASYKYDRGIVIFKEKDVSFPSDFRDLGYIEFEKGQLRGKSMELLRELIALKAVKLLPGS